MTTDRPKKKPEKTFEEALGNMYQCPQCLSILEGADCTFPIADTGDYESACGICGFDRISDNELSPEELLEAIATLSLAHDKIRDKSKDFDKYGWITEKDIHDTEPPKP